MNNKNKYQKKPESTGLNFGAVVYLFAVAVLGQNHPNLQQCSLELFRICSVVLSCLEAVLCQRRSVGSALIEGMFFSCSFRRASIQLRNPPLPPVFYSLCFPFTLASRVTANIVFLVNENILVDLI